MVDSASPAAELAAQEAVNRLALRRILALVLLLDGAAMAPEAPANAPLLFRTDASVKSSAEVSAGSRNATRCFLFSAAVCCDGKTLTPCITAAAVRMTHLHGSSDCVTTSATVLGS